MGVPDDKTIVLSLFPQSPSHASADWTRVC